MSNFDFLPKDIKKYILSFLKLKTLAKVAGVSKEWRELSYPAQMTHQLAKKILKERYAVNRCALYVDALLAASTAGNEIIVDYLLNNHCQFNLKFDSGYRSQEIDKIGLAIEESAKPEIATKIAVQLNELLQTDDNRRRVKYSRAGLSLLKRKVNTAKDANEFMALFNDQQDYKKEADKFLIEKTAIAKFLLKLADEKGIDFNELNGEQLYNYTAFTARVEDENIKKYFLSKLKGNNQFFKEVYAEAEKVYEKENRKSAQNFYFKILLSHLKRIRPLQVVSSSEDKIGLAADADEQRPTKFFKR